MENKEDLAKLREEIEEMYDFSLKNLKAEKHNQVNDVFTYLFQNDIRLKEKLAKAFMPGEDGVVMDPDKIQSLIEMQALHNSFHLNLFNSITDHLIEKFKIALEFMDKNLEDGSKISFEAQKLVRFYEVKLDKLMAPIDTLQGSTYNDLKESYKSVTVRRNEMIMQITQKVIQKEQELMLQ